MMDESGLIKKVVLLAEDDAIFRRLMAKKLAAAGFYVREAASGLIAKNIFDESPSSFSLVLTDVKMPELDGVQLLAHMRKSSKIPVVVMTGFSEILESKAALDLGANGFLPKPFKADTLLGVIEDAMNPESKRLKREEASAQFCQIHISEFGSYTHLISDIYVRLAQAKYVKVAHRGDPIPIERLKVYKERNVDFLYVAIEDSSQYVKIIIKAS
jgi:DNA-binding NtrC family response regulator